MAIELVQFEDKQNINEKPELPRINKVIDEDVNELKGKLNDSINVVNELSEASTSLEVDSNGWTKVKGINVTTYFKNYNISTSIAGNGFLNFPDQPLPVDITTYDSTKMTASLATRFTDGAGIINAGISNGYKSISMCGQNKYGSQINGSIICNFRIDVYNS